MPKIESLLNRGDEITDAAEQSVIEAARKAEEELYREISKIFNEVDVSAGKLKDTKKAREFLLSIDKRIKEVLNNSEYKTAVSGLIKDFDKITQNNIDLQAAINKKIISKKQLLPIQQLEVNNTIERLLGSGIDKDFVAPIRQTLYRNIVLGVGVEETRSALEDFILSKPKKESVLSRYVGQVSRDSIMQFDGSIQQSIGAELELPDYIYTGSLILDSRAQCVHWVNKAELPGEELEAEIKTAVNGGTFPDSEKKCSGMNPSTTLSTFSIYRGGYNCRHRAIVTLL
jgi:hypothetical protein